MGKASVLLPVIGALIISVPLSGTAPANAQGTSGKLPAPKGLSSFAPSDSVAVSENRVTITLGSEFLSWFQSDKKIIVRGATKLVSVPLEYAIAIDLAGGPYTSADLDKLLSIVTEQWKDFQSLSKEFHENYIARPNELNKGADAT
jgi:hypothetical protein